MSRINTEEKEKFDQLYQYIKKEIFGYDDKQKLPKYMVLRLIGLKDGKFIANNKTNSMAQYDYLHILYTFKINKMKIQNIVQSSNFENERHKFNTIMLIIENEINDVVNRLKQVKKSEEEIKSMSVDNIIHEGANYKNKNIHKKFNKELEELW